MADPNMPSQPSFPFDDPDADVIIQSIDGCQFRVFKIILALASPYFRTMFTLPQNTETSDPTTPPCISLTEDSRTIKLMLQSCYPVNDPEITSLDDIKILLEVAQKYDIPMVLERMRKLLVAPSFLENEPLRVYAIAHHYRLEQEALQGARSTLAHTMPFSYVEDLELYHRCCSDAARAAALYSAREADGKRVVGDCFGHDEIGKRFCEDAERRLEDQPCAKTITNPDLLAHRIEELRHHGNVYTQMVQFVRVNFSNAIEEATAKVELELKF